ncbi:MAG: XrtA/PEP-CTERM system histidine kinase PrsK [Gammaproteobacteria bacterium]
MHSIIIVSYLTAAAAFVICGGLLLSSWRGQRIGALLMLAITVSAAWSAFVAYTEWQGTVPAAWVLIAEILRYGAWLVFVTALFSSWAMSRLIRSLRVGVHVLWIALALYCLWPVTGFVQSTAISFAVSVPIVGMLILALIGLVFLEQLYRNVLPEQHWALKFLVIGLGILFAYDIFLYSYAALYRQFNPSAWAARGFINALVAPLLVVAAARNAQWSLQVAVSRRAVFYSTSLLVVAFYIIATAVGGYYVRLYGGDWGRVAEIALICFAALLLLLIAFSGQARSRLRMFLHKNFFNFRHDYREEWLRLTATLSMSSGELRLRAVQALAQIMDSPAGALFTRSETGDFVPAAHWNMPVPVDLRVASAAPLFDFMRERQWIYDFGQSSSQNDAKLAAPSELCALPRAWLMAPLILDGGLMGFVVLAQARARRKIDWEDINLLRTAGRQVASTLAQAESAQHLAEARQFEGFNRLTAFMMHDLKNLVAQQSLLLKNAQRHKHNPAFVEDMLTTVENSVRRTTRLLEQLRGDAPSGVRHRIHLVDTIAKALAECGQQAPKPVYTPINDKLCVQADAEQLATVLGHVIRNAQDAAHASGHVNVRLRRADHQVAIEVEDDGDGMDEEFIRNRLFKPFFTTKSSKGMGIGAYQAREYVQLLGGRVTVNSTVGRGTLFTLFLPLDVSTDEVVQTGNVRAVS